MSKLTQIEQALKALNPAGFQRLCDSYLYARGHNRINPIGLVIGADKVKRGTPDTLVPLSDGTYVFAEYTTQTDGVATKLLSDMDKCFDEAKTGVPAKKIREFIACHTSVLSPADEHILVEAGRRRGCIVTLLGIGPISHDLHQRYPGLARDFLGIEVDTGQIVNLDEFVSAYGQNALATPLDTTIRFRDDDIQRGVAALQSNDILIIAGAAGVGKSRLALECCRVFVKEHPSFSAKGIRYRGADLFEDVRVYFSAPGSYLVFVDDANRVSGFDYILQLLQEQTQDRHIKLVVTVRDYALEAVMRTARPYGGTVVQTVNALSDEQIREIVSADFEIGNHLYLERITEIARGNPRIAVMAARVAVRENTLKSLADVSSLYDEYFFSIRQDLADLGDPEMLRAAGILAFFRNVDKKNSEQMELIEAVFGAYVERFWTAVRRLNDIEIVDLYEDEVARISDQVLATFAFHLVFFKDRALDPAAFLHPQIFPAYKTRLFDALNPAIAAFDGVAIGDLLRPVVQRRWKDLDSADDEEGLLHLVDAFGQLDETATLAFVRDRVQAMEYELADLSAITFKASGTSRPSLWSILAGFRNSDIVMVRLALTLAADMVAKRSLEAPEALSLLTERFGIKHTSYIRGFEVERAVVETLWDRVRDPTNDALEPLFLRLFLLTAQPLLRTHFDTHEAKGELAITIMRFDVPATPELKDFRQSIWSHIAALLQDDSARSAGLDFIRDHAGSGFTVRDAELLRADAATVLPALETLDSSNYAHCATVQAYLQLLTQRRVELDPDEARQRDALHDRFNCSTYQLAALLTDDFEDIEERAKLGWEEYNRIKRERLTSYVQGYTASQFDDLITECVAIRDERYPLGLGKEGNNVRRSRDHFQLQAGVGTFFEAIASRDPELFDQIVRRYLERGNPLDLGPHGILPMLLSTVGPDRAYVTLTTCSFPGQGFWLAAFLGWIPVEAVTKERLNLLYAHYDTADASELLRDMDYLAKYEHVDSRVVQTVTSKLLRKTQDDVRVGAVLADALDGRGEVGGRLREVFGGSSDDIALLKRAYFAASRADVHVDYQATTFGTLLDLDPGFGAEWVDWMYEQNAPNGWLSAYDEHRDYSALWMRSDFLIAMKSILQRVLHHEGSRFGMFSYADAFLRVEEGSPQKTAIQNRQDQLLRVWVEESALDLGQAKFMFSLANTFSPERRRALVETFIGRNANHGHFEQLPLEPNEWSWSGSEVPLLQKRVEFFESLLPLFNTLPMLDHRRFVEGQITYLREKIEAEKREDFLRA